MADTGDINVGSIIRFNGELVQITEYQHRTPGNLRAFYQAKMRSLLTGKQTENRFRSGELVVVEEGETPILAEAPTFVEAQITYAEPGVKGDTATNTLKPAKIDTGTEVM